MTVCSLLIPLMPTFAILTMNHDWSFNIDLIGIIYKPWRLFLFICGVPNLMCALVLIFVIPESPKFTYAQGDEAKTMEIFRKMYQMNTGNLAEIFELTKFTQNEEVKENVDGRDTENFFKRMWTQTALLFKGSHRRNVLTACFIQFTLCNVSNGFKTFFPEIFNKVTLWTKDGTFEPATLCEIYNAQSLSFNQTSLGPQCVQKLEVKTYMNIYESRLGSLLGFILLSLIINRTGKLVIIEVIVFSTAISTFLLIFIKIPTVSFYLFLMILISNLAVSVVNASTIELFPTSLRFVENFYSVSF